MPAKGSRIPRVKKTCRMCDKEFELLPCVAKRSKGWYCSRKCSTDYLRQTGRVNYTGRPKGKQIKKVCPKCKKTFSVRPSEVKSKTHCSMKCRERKVKIKCIHCGKEIKVGRHYVKRGQYKYCSDSCRHEAGRKGYTVEELTYICKKCDKEYRINPCEVGKSQYCSMACRWVPEKECIVCGKMFPLAWDNRKYCGQACYRKSKKPTGIEVAVKHVLRILGEPFFFQHRIGRYSIDFLLPRLNLVLEADGDYWHSRPPEKARRERRDAFLKKQGLRVVHLTETEINSDPDASVKLAITSIENLLL